MEGHSITSKMTCQSNLPRVLQVTQRFQSVRVGFLERSLSLFTKENIESDGSVSKSTGLSVPRVVIPVAKKTAAKKQPRTKKAETKGVKKSQTQSASDSSDDSELEIEAPPEPSPIPPIRPNEPIAAAEYDTLTAVWSPRNKWPAADKVKSALVAFKDVIKSLRDSWKDQVAAMKLAENQGDNDKASKIKDGVALQRRVMDKIMTTTLNMGHPMIVEKYAAPFKLPNTFCLWLFWPWNLQMEYFFRVNPSYGHGINCLDMARIKDIFPIIQCLHLDNWVALGR